MKWFSRIVPRLDRGLLAVSLVFVISVVVYLFKQFSTPLLFYIDGPYYYVQVRSILEQGCLRYADPPLTFYILTFFSIVFRDIVVGVKVGSTILILLGVYPLYYLIRDLTGSRVAGYASSILYALSPTLLRISLDFIKNSIGLTFLFFTILFIYKSIRYNSMKYSILATAFIILTGLTHILDFGVVLFIVVAITVIHLLREHRVPKTLILPISTCIILVILGFTYYSLMGGDPYKGVSLASKIVHLNIDIEPRILGLTIYPLIMSIIGITISFTKILDILSRRLLIIISITMLILSLPIYPRDYQVRFVFEVSTLTPIIAGIVIGLIHKASTQVLVTIMIASMLIPSFTHQLLEAQPSISIEEYNEIKELVRKIPENTVLVVPATPLRYWVETVTFNVVKKIEDVPTGKQPVLVFNQIHRRRPPPPIARPIYIGKYIQAYILPPKPR